MGILKCSEYYCDGKLYFKGDISLDDKIDSMARNIDSNSNIDFRYNVNLKCKYFDDMELKIFGYFGNGTIYKVDGNIIKIELDENYTGEITENDSENNLINQVEYLEKIHGKKITFNENKEKVIEFFNNGVLKSKSVYSKNNILISDVIYSDNFQVTSFKCYFENGV